MIVNVQVELAFSCDGDMSFRNVRPEENCGVRFVFVRMTTREDRVMRGACFEIGPGETEQVAEFNPGQGDLVANLCHECTSGLVPSFCSTTIDGSVAPSALVGGVYKFRAMFVGACNPHRSGCRHQKVLTTTPSCPFATTTW